MSELRTDTITASDGTSPVTLTKQSAAKSWASIDQTSTGHPVYDSFNVSGTADIDSGRTKITFSNVMNNANYGISGAGQTADYNATNFGLWAKSTDSSRQMTTADFHTSNRNDGGSHTDTKYFAFDVNGDLA